MADEVVQQRHAELAQEHQRKAEWHAGLSDGSQPETTNIGSQAGGFFGAIMEHKWIVIGAIAAVIVFIIAMQGFNNQSNSSTANQAPNLTNAGYVPSDISTSLDNINSAISGLSQQISQNQTGTTSTTTGTSSGTTNLKTAPTNQLYPGGNPNGPPIIAIATNNQTNTLQPQYVQSTPWPTATSTLSGIAQSSGISLSRIEQLNPNLYNRQQGSGLNIIYPGQKVSIS